MYSVYMSFKNVKNWNNQIRSRQTTYMYTEINQIFITSNNLIPHVELWSPVSLKHGSLFCCCCCRRRCCNVKRFLPEVSYFAPGNQTDTPLNKRYSTSPTTLPYKACRIINDTGWKRRILSKKLRLHACTD